MSTSPNRRRIEIDSAVYDLLEQDARWLHIPVASLATLLIREGLERSARVSSLAAQIVAEGSPSPTLALLQQRVLDDVRS